MKKLLLFTALIAVMASCGKKSGYTINGEVTGLDATTVYLADAVKGSGSPIDSATVTDGKFKFTGKVESPIVAIITSEKYRTGFFVLDNSKITITGVSSPDETYTVVNGGAETNAYAELNQTKDSINNIARGISGQVNETNRDSLMRIMRKYQEEIGSLDKAFIENNPANVAAAYTLRSISSGMNAQDILAAYDKLQSPAKESEAAVKLKSHADAMIATEVGKKFTDFSSKDAKGNEIALSSVVGEGKYVLLDFWAAWCPPCMAEMPHLLAAYEKYSPKGFEIYGYSLDNDRDKWINTSNELGIGWVNVSDIAYWAGEPCALYAVRSIPANFLIDPSGVIIAKNLRGKALEEKLSELLD